MAWEKTQKATGFDGIQYCTCEQGISEIRKSNVGTYTRRMAGGILQVHETCHISEQREQK